MEAIWYSAEVSMVLEQKSQIEYDVKVTASMMGDVAKMVDEEHIKGKVAVYQKIAVFSIEKYRIRINI